jgi:hypothetical protein
LREEALREVLDLDPPTKKEAGKEKKPPDAAVAQK